MSHKVVVKGALRKPSTRSGWAASFVIQYGWLTQPYLLINHKFVISGNQFLNVYLPIVETGIPGAWLEGFEVRELNAAWAPIWEDPAGGRPTPKLPRLPIDRISPLEKRNRKNDGYDDDNIDDDSDDDDYDDHIDDTDDDDNNIDDYDDNDYDNIDDDNNTDDYDNIDDDNTNDDNNDH